LLIKFRSETESEIEYDDEEEEEEEKEKAEEHEDHDFSKILMKKMQARRCLIVSHFYQWIRTIRLNF